MFQSFDPPLEAAAGAGRVKRLRELMARLAIDAVLVPRADAHQGEYVPRSAERLKWLTGFSGSAGSAIVTGKAAALFVDGRYTTQARAQVDTAIFEIRQVPLQRASDWLIGKLGAGATVGFDPWLATVATVEQLTETLARKGIKLRPLARNPIDALWGRGRTLSETHGPAIEPIVPHPVAQAGRAMEEKIAELQQRLKDDGQDAVVLTLPDSICWLLNIRGRDVAHNPVVLSFAIVPAHGKVDLFTEHARSELRLDKQAKAHLAGRVRVHEKSALGDRLAALRSQGRKVRLDPDTAAWWIARRLGGPKRIVRAADPCIGPKARKNSTELDGARAAHKRDGVAMARFLAWLDREAVKGRVDEIEAARHLEQCRAETQMLREISFDTISGAGANGAIVHYRVTTATNRTLKPGELYLVDSGGQYPDGTTDVTRTIAIGRPSEEMRERFTLVLKGHIAIATARFPKGTRGNELDPFARRALWTRGLDFDHGTGHGVGSFLSVHEGPQSISRRGAAELQPGMIVSNEPGYYKEGAYGIRIENLEVVTEPSRIAGGDREMMGLEALTLVPMDRRLVVKALLSPEEIVWLDAYHARVRSVIGPELGGADRDWLEAATRPIG